MGKRRKSEGKRKTAGYVYVLHSDHLPGWSKVGFTTRTPWERAREMSTGLPGLLKVYAAREVSHARRAESCVHRVLKGFRHKSGDEWFELSPSDAIILVDDALETTLGRAFKWFRRLLATLACAALVWVWTTAPA